MMKTHVKFQKDWLKTVGGVALTLSIINQAPRKAEYYVPSLFFEKAGDNKRNEILLKTIITKFFDID